MIRTIEALFVVIIVLGSLMGVIYYVDLPSPRSVTSIGLGDLAKSTLKSFKFNTNSVFQKKRYYRQGTLPANQDLT